MSTIKFKTPAKKGYTIYCLSDCKYCDMTKNDIESTKKIINCDEYIKTLRNRDNFLKFIIKYTLIPYQYFPMIFFNGKFIGGYHELKNSIERKGNKKPKKLP